MRRVLAFLGLCVAAAIALNLLYAYTHMEGYCIFYPSIDTRYAAGYTEREFDNLPIHATTNEVLRRLGAPLRIENNKYGSQSWWYSDDGACRFGDFAWLGREVIVESGIVTRTVKTIFYD